MKSEFVDRESKTKMKNAIRLTPESDADIVRLAVINQNADPNNCTLMIEDETVRYLYISVEALVKVASS